MDAKISEQLREIDIENLGKYFQTSQDNTIKNDILSELLRSSAFEKSRVKKIKI